MTIQNQFAKLTNEKLFLIDENEYFINENEQATATTLPVLLKYVK